jgi:predicted Zn finger-like uncharacterized protein
MDVRCEKCQTEYELDESRLKPGGVTVKCTNCGHMFKIRKRSNTNVGMPPPEGPRTPTPPPVAAPAPAAAAVVSVAAPQVQTETVRTRPVSSKPPMDGLTGMGVAPTGERQWQLRLDNGETKTCRELATLQQWIVAGVASRDALISRSGKTWKRLGDIAELATYFRVADEAKATRAERETNPPKPAGAKPGPDLRATLVGMGNLPAVSKAAGGTIVPDRAGTSSEYTDVSDDVDELRTTGNYKNQRVSIPPPMPVSAKTPPVGTPVPPASAGAGSSVRPPIKTPPAGAPVKSDRGERGDATPPPRPTAPPPRPDATPLPARLDATPPPAPPLRRVPTQPPPPPQSQARTQSQSGPLPTSGAPSTSSTTGGWASTQLPEGDRAAAAAGDRAFSGRLAAIPDEPAFAGNRSGRVRTEPSDDGVFTSGRVGRIEDDDSGPIAARRGSSAGKWIALLALLVMGGAAAVLYVVVIRDKKGAGTTASALRDAGAVATTSADATPAGAAGATDGGDATPTADPLDAARAELASDLEPRLRAARAALDGQDGPAALATRSLLATALAQGLEDRAGLTTDKAEADKLRRDARQLVLDAAPLAQRVLKAKVPEPAANLAMAEVLRLQGKSAKEVHRYLDAAKPRDASDHDAALAAALLLARDGKLAEATSALTALDQGAGRLETSGDVRVRLRLALLGFAGGKGDAKQLVDQVLAAQPDHATARALAGRLHTQVATTDPLPPEAVDAGAAPPTAGSGAGSAGSAGPIHGVTPSGNGGNGGNGGEDSYDVMLGRADKYAEVNCEKAKELYQKALDLKPNGVEALTGMGFCHIDAKQYASAFSKFRAALAISPRNERALWGVAEAYQHMGRRDNAAEAYQRYLEVYPDSAAAKKQLDMLGGGANGGGPPAGSGAPTGGSGQSGGGPTTTPTPDPAPTPAPGPAAPAAGSAAP